MRVRSQLPIAAVLLLAACQSGEPTGSQGPRALVLGTAVSATASVGSTLSPTFLVQDAAGQPVAGVPVAIAVSQGLGQVAGAPTVSGAGATAAGVWTLGSTPGPQTLTIVVANVPPLVITVLAVPGAAQQITLDTVPTVGQVGAATPLPVVARVIDAFNNPVPQQSVTFAVTAGHGRLEGPAVGVTDAAGRVRAPVWTLDSLAGVNTLALSVEGLPVVTASVTTVALAPNALRLIGTYPSAAPAGSAMSTGSVRVVDRYGNGVAGVQVVVAVGGGGGTIGSGTQSATTARTDSTGTTPLPVWTLGARPGDQLLVMTSGSLAPVTVRITATAGAATTLAIVSGNAQVGPALTVLPQRVRAHVGDALGNAVGGVSLSCTVTQGGGSMAATPTVTDVVGNADCPAWTLGAAGAQAVQVAGAGLTPVTATASVIVAPAVAAAITVVSGNAQQVQAGATAAPITLQVLDASGQPIASRAVSFAVQAGGGSLSSATGTTDAGGRVSLGWTMGLSNVPQSVRATAGSVGATVTATIATQFSIDVRYVGAAGTPAIEAAAQAAVARLTAMVVAPLAPVTFAGLNVATTCGVPGADPYTGTTATVVVYVQVHTMDGPGGAWAQGGPCIVRSGSSLPALGSLMLDAQDVDNIVAQGLLNAVVLHEMLHVLGFGTIWPDQGLVQGAGTPASAFLGASARQGCLTLGGSAATVCASSVPLETGSGGGHDDSHWRESVFGAELMTPFVSPGANPVSRMTLGSLTDLGYAVAPQAYEAFSLATASTAASQLVAREGATGLVDVLQKPRWTIDRTGHLVPRP